MVALLNNTLRQVINAFPYQMIAHDALSALINLSDTLIVARHLADETFLAFLISYTCVSSL